MKWKIIAIYSVSVLVIMVLLTGCDLQFGSQSVQHSFLQERTNVEKVEICTYCNDGYPIGTITPIVALSDGEIDSLWADLLELPAVTILPAKQESRLGDILFVIRYVDGEQELIGFVEQGIICEDGTFGGYRGYAFRDNQELAKVFAKYADPETLAEMSKEFEHWFNLANS